MCRILTCSLGCFLFKQKTAYEIRISDWSSDVCSSDLLDDDAVSPALLGRVERRIGVTVELLERARAARLDGADAGGHRTIADRRAVIERQIGRASCRARVCQDV